MKVADATVQVLLGVANEEKVNVLSRRIFSHGLRTSHQIDLVEKLPQTLAGPTTGTFSFSECMSEIRFSP